MVFLVCPICGKEFKKTHKGHKYCSYECAHKSQITLKDKVCENCGKVYHPLNAGQKFCSQKCSAEYLGYEATCVICGKKFKSKTSCAKYCSAECEKKKNIVLTDVKICEYCGKEFHPRHKNSGGKYCSNKCRQMSRRTIKGRICPTCGNTFTPIRDSKIYCSKECYSKAQSKEWYKLDKDTQKEIISNMVSKATNKISKINLQYKKYFEEKGFDVNMEFELEGYFYDLKIGNVLIEINPFPYHNSTWNPFGKKISKNYHYNKMKLANDNGYRCIMVRDWDDMEKVFWLLDENKIKVGARECKIKKLTYEECHSFFDNNHLQGDTKKSVSNIYIGLEYGGELIECISFGKPRYNNKYEWELLRLCTHRNYKVIGGASKIFKHFLSLTNAKSVISYCDMSKFDGKVYEGLGFELLKDNSPSKHRYNGKTKQHITDNLLRQRGFDQLFGTSYGKGTNNEELMIEHGFVEIYDCGQSTFIYNI